MVQTAVTGFGEAERTKSQRVPLDPEPNGRRQLCKAWIALAISVVAFAATLVGVFAFESVTLAPVGFGAAALVALVGVARGVAATVRSFQPSAQVLGGIRFGAFAAIVVNLFMAVVGAFAAFLSTVSFSRGRQLRHRGRVLLAPVAPGAGWTRAAVPPVHGVAPLGVAAQWRENGRTEHASVAAFARLTLDLMALGAPARLVADAQRDALDEIRHTELCFDLASAMDGTVSSPAAFSEASRARTLPSDRRLALALLAVDSLVDGALNEGVSARVVARLARCVEDPTIAKILVEIAADEGRHAAHGWDVVLYCVAEGGDSVIHALQGAARALPERMRPNASSTAQSGAWERWGIPGATLEDAEYQKARADVLRRVGQLASRVTVAA